MHAVGKDLPFYRFSPPTAAIEPDDSFQSRRLCWAFLFHVHHPSTHTHTRFPSLILQIIFLPLWTWLRKMVDNNDQKVFWLVRPPVFLCLAATQYFPYTDRNSCHLSCINLSAKRVFLSFLLFLYVDDKKGSNLLSMRKWNQRKPFTRSHYSINLVAYR